MLKQVNSFLIVALSITCIFPVNLFSQESYMEKWENALVLKIDVETVKQAQKGCLVNSKSWKEFYKNELEYFPIRKAFERIEYLSKNLDRKESIIFELYYPIVGFDPEIGYETNLYVKKRRKIIKIETYDDSIQDFKRGTASHKYISKRLKRKSDCYGTGYLFITVFDENMEVSDVNVILSMELK